MFDALKRVLAPGRPAAPDPADAYREALRNNPDQPEACANLGLLLAQRGQPDEAEALLRRAAKLSPGNLDIATHLRVFLSRRAQVWQFPMMNDTARNEAYERAIARAVRPDDHVLEIGTGSGLLAMMAARAGAKRVTTCETLLPVAEKAEKIIAANGLREAIEVIPVASTSPTVPGDLDAPADILISEIVASDLIGEHMLAIVQDAALRLLTPEARMIPSRAWIRGQLCSAPEVERYQRVGITAGFDLSGFNEFAPVTLIPGDLGIEAEACSEPFDLFHFDFTARRPYTDESKRMRVAATRAVRCHGVLQWIRLGLYDEIEIENSPGASEVGKGHWKRTLHLFAQPLDVKPGQTVELVLAHNRRNLTIYAAG